MEEKERLEELLKRITYWEQEVRSSESRYRNATTREKRKAEEEYVNKREWARDFISSDLRDFIFDDERSGYDIALWLGELPNAYDISRIRERIEKRIQELNNNP